ncbi:MAG TPA: glycosyltransferase family 39 protein, partial [Ardenticatenaceae bacterium]|nr:glycosyltransferase family 39 protein [Ardenticatenaceae bacterium]
MLARRVARRFTQLAPLALMLALFLGWQSANLGAFAQDYDEGVYLSEAVLVREGYALYSEVKSPVPPLFIWGLVASFTVAGEANVEAARLAIVLSAALGLAAAAMIGRRLAPSAGARAGLPAAALLGLMPLWFLYARLAMTDVPSLSLTLAAIALALRSWRSERRAWLALGGATAAVALLIKLQAAYAAPLLALVVALRPRRERSGVRWLRGLALDGVMTLAGFLFPFVVVLPLLDLRSAYELVVRYHWEASRLFADRVASLRTVIAFLRQHLGWLLLAFTGLAWLAYRRAWRPAILLGGWFLLVVALLVEHAPLSGHLLLPLVPPLALAGGIALAEALAALRQGPPARGTSPYGLRATHYALLASTTAAVFLTLLLWPAAVRFDVGQILLPPRLPVLQHSVLPWLVSTVPIDQTIISDDAMVVFRARRRLPPNLTDTSFKRIRSGFLTADELIATAERERPAAIIFWSNRLARLPAWRAWVEGRYVLACQFGSNQAIF